MCCNVYFWPLWRTESCFLRKNFHLSRFKVRCTIATTKSLRLSASYSQRYTGSYFYVTTDRGTQLCAKVPSDPCFISFGNPKELLSQVGRSGFRRLLRVYLKCKAEKKGRKREKQKKWKRKREVRVKERKKDRWKLCFWTCGKRVCSDFLLFHLRWEKDAFVLKKGTYKKPLNP